MRAVLMIVLCLVVGCKEKGPTKAELIQELGYEQKEIAEQSEKLAFMEGASRVLEGQLISWERLPENEKMAKAQKIAELRNELDLGKVTIKNMRDEIEERTQKTYKLQAKIDAMP